MSEGPRSAVVIVPVSSTCATLRIEPSEHEFIDGWEWKVVGEWMHIEATLFGVGYVRAEHVVLRASAVERVMASEGTPKKREEGSP